MLLTISLTTLVIITMDEKEGNGIVDKIFSVLRVTRGLTITEIVDKVEFNRSAVRIALAKLDGARKVKIRKIGMAKVYTLESNQKKKEEKIK
jgi:predicted transcriptional regulator